MTALAVDRNTPERAGQLFQGPCVATDIIYKGSLVCRDSSGNIAPITATTGLIGVGRAESYVDNSAGAAGDLNVDYRAGTFRWGNGDTITKAHIGDTAYGFDDQTVKRVSTGLSPVGIIVDVDADGVWVDTNPGNVLASTGLLAANNLSDVGTVATARANLSLDTANSPTFADLTLTGSLTAADEIVSTDPLLGVGYATGAGGTVTQITTITTGVTINKVCGTITTVSSTLATGVDASFVVTNSAVAATDVVVASIKSYGGTADGIPVVAVQATGAGSFTLNIMNNGAVTLDAVIVISFAVIKAVAA